MSIDLRYVQVNFHWIDEYKGAKNEKTMWKPYNNQLDAHLFFSWFIINKLTIKYQRIHRAWPPVTFSFSKDSNCQSMEMVFIRSKAQKLKFVEAA